MATRTAPKKGTTDKTPTKGANPAAAAAGDGTVKTLTSALGGIEIQPHDTHPKVRLKDVQISPRPKPGEENFLFFYNPRPEDEVNDPKTAFPLQYSMRLEGNLEAPVARGWTDPNDKSVITKINHIAGERRLTQMNVIYDQDLPCVDEKSPKPEVFEAGACVNWKNRFGTVVKQDEDGTVTIHFDDHLNDTHGSGNIVCDYADVLPTKGGREMFEWISIKLYLDISDERAMRIAWSENANSEPLSVKAEVALVERLLAMGKKQAEVAYILDTNITFVSQRASFRTQLPKAAFEKLMAGQMAAHMGVHLLSIDPANREAYYEALVKSEQIQSTQEVQKLRSEKERLEDEADLHETEAKAAEKKGDTKTAAAETRKAQSASGKAKKAADRLKRVESEKGTIKQGHTHMAQQMTGITPRKGKMLAREQIEEQVKALMKASTDDVEDPITGETIPQDYASIARRVLMAVMTGGIDPLAPIRDYMVSNGKWDLPEETKAGKGGKSSPAKEEPDEDDLDEEEELDEEDDLDITNLGDDSDPDDDDDDDDDDGFGDDDDDDDEEGSVNDRLREFERMGGSYD